MALVAHMLHMPIGDLDDMEMGELLMWADEAGRLAKTLYPAR